MTNTLKTKSGVSYEYSLEYDPDFEVKEENLHENNTIPDQFGPSASKVPRLDEGDCIFSVPLELEEPAPKHASPKTTLASTNPIGNQSQEAEKGPVELTEPRPCLPDENQEKGKSTSEPSQPIDKTVREQGTTSSNLKTSAPITMKQPEASAIPQRKAGQDGLVMVKNEKGEKEPAPGLALPETLQESTHSTENPNQEAVKEPVELTEPRSCLPDEHQEKGRSTLEESTQPINNTVREQGTSTSIASSAPIKIEPLEAPAIVKHQDVLVVAKTEPGGKEPPVEPNHTAHSTQIKTEQPATNSEASKTLKVPPVQDSILKDLDTEPDAKSGPSKENNSVEPLAGENGPVCMVCHSRSQSVQVERGVQCRRLKLQSKGTQTYFVSYY